MYSLHSDHALGIPEMQTLAPSIFSASPVSGVSERYTFLPTSSILDGMRKNGWLPVQAQEQKVRTEDRRGFQKHLIRFQRMDHIGLDMSNKPEVVLVNSHDKSSAYKLFAGIFRFVCSNGMIIADSVFESISIKHYGFNPDSVIEASYEILSSIPQIMDNVNEMEAIKLNRHEQQAFAKGALALRWNDPEQAPISAEKVLTPRRVDDMDTSLYTTLNVIQENLIKGGQKDYSQRNKQGRLYARTRSIKGIDENVALNRGLWHMAQELKKAIQS